MHDALGGLRPGRTGPGPPKGNAPTAAGQSPENRPAITEKAAADGPPAGATAAGTKPATIREKAAVGMGEKGRGYGGGMETVAVMAMWRAEEKIVLDQIHHDMDLYKGSTTARPRRRTRNSWNRSSMPITKTARVAARTALRLRSEHGGTDD